MTKHDLKELIKDTDVAQIECKIAMESIESKLVQAYETDIHRENARMARDRAYDNKNLIEITMDLNPWLVNEIEMEQMRRLIGLVDQYWEAVCYLYKKYKREQH